MLQEDIKQELKRKAFHILSLFFPLSYVFISKPLAITLMLLITIITIFIDVARHYNRSIREIVDKFFLSIMRPFEKSGFYKLSGSSYMALGFLISTIIFSKGVAIASCCVLVISDSFAALFGKKIGRDSNHGKSFEGATAFFLSALMISMFAFQIESFNTNFWILVIASLATSSVEYYSYQIGINDNLTIPLTFGSVVTLLGFIFL